MINTIKQHVSAKKNHDHQGTDSLNLFALRKLRKHNSVTDFTEYFRSFFKKMLFSDS